MSDANSLESWIYYLLIVPLSCFPLSTAIDGRQRSEINIAYINFVRSSLAGITCHTEKKPREKKTSFKWHVDNRTSSQWLSGLQQGHMCLLTSSAWRKRERAERERLHLFKSWFIEWWLKCIKHSSIPIAFHFSISFVKQGGGLNLHRLQTVAFLFLYGMPRYVCSVLCWKSMQEKSFFEKIEEWDRKKPRNFGTIKEAKLGKKVSKVHK